MKSCKKIAIKVFQTMLCLMVYSAMAFSQVIDQAQIDMFRAEPLGDFQWRRQGMLDGNQVRTVFFNDGTISDWFDGGIGGVKTGPHGEWPKGTGHRNLDGIAVLIASKVKTFNTILNREVTITPLESAYREFMDYDPKTGMAWGFNPVPGYISPTSKSPAIDDNPTTYPEKWPRSMFYDSYGTNEEEISKWDGYWYGYFGRGVHNAQKETFFVIDDSKDKEWQTKGYKFYPLASDSNRGGLGLRVEVRAFQWSHVLAEDIIFWHYDIVNLSDFNYDTTSFGFYTDTGVGSVNNDAAFDSQLNLAYSWAASGKGLPGDYKTGYYGQSFLESPGNGKNKDGSGGDGIDNDGDGLVDEGRNDGIDNDGDWLSYTDVNNDGVWSANEPLNDDVGTDGVGQWDEGYKGPDADGSQGNGVPNINEPHFDKTDKDESDQVGLQAGFIKPLDNSHGDSGPWIKNDEVFWSIMTGGFDTIPRVTNTNIQMAFASGLFPLKKNQRERFSVAIVFGDDLNDLVENKKTVQAIYDAEYNFAQPPIKPTLSASAGDRKVYLTWNSDAEQSYDKFLKEFDFEGYALYRSQEPEFLDLKTITDAHGTPVYWKPIARWDIVDSVKGPDLLGVKGAHYDLGSDNGLVHSYIDTDVKNGVKYYYALVSYDRGKMPSGIDTISYSVKGGLQPTECSKQIIEDFNGTLSFVDRNCAVVVPNAKAAGTVDASINGSFSKLTQGQGSGSMEAAIVSPPSVLEGYTYKIMFESQIDVAPAYHTTGFYIQRTSPAGAVDMVGSKIAMSSMQAVTQSHPFDGMIVTIRNDTLKGVVDSLTGWLAGHKTNTILVPTVDRTNASRNYIYPANYQIEFFSFPVDTPAIGSGKYIKVPVHFTVTNMTQGRKTNFLLYDTDGSNSLTSGDSIKILEDFVASPLSYKMCYNILYFENPINSTAPTDGDKFYITTNKQFASGDYFQFTSKAASASPELAKGTMNTITVVPNPYIQTATWERRNLYASGRGERRINFNNLPVQCTIRIYTTAGALVKTLYKNDVQSGTISWDMISDDGMDVAYGLYIFHVDAPNVGEHIGKFAIIK